ncbi:hypothetical protein C0991_011078, partial [Blastosporella zonata]
MTKAASRVGISNVMLLDINIVVKLSEDDDLGNVREVLVQELLFAKTTIPIARIRRVLPYKDRLIIAMDYIPGQTLKAAWDTISIFRKIWIVFTLRRYIRQLRQLQASSHTPPGALTNNGPKESISVVWGQITSKQGPFDSYHALSTFMYDRSQLWADYRALSIDSPFRQDTLDFSQPMVLTHNDLHMENVILGDDGR